MSEVSEMDAARALLRWHLEMGVDETVAPAPADFYAWQAPQTGGQSANAPARRGAAPRLDAVKAEAQAVPAAPAAPETVSTDEAIRAAETAAAACDSFEALDAAVKAFEGCPLKAGAKNTVFTDGVPGSDLLVIGEAPGRDEDRLGKPFVGRAGQLLDRMLAAIGRARTENVLISNVIFWRPPANRTPTALETAVCRPFVDRLIELTGPKAVLIAGGAPLQALLGVTGIMRARGVWREIETASGARFPALPTYHPAFLLRQPAGKRLAWADLQSLDQKLKGR
ncbi:uracil-DNA glycosylase [Hyphococcus luteus]|uniref:Type-4 uracil-DNA glycosylase n=1 Tax=Hyphococcus luteus TaxID=2058213 RepID=A0A2S7K5R9_9PROT|nr:uracil-DNA glycosylase [Marinicaulis flavus]PQA87821.1 uracil-DNA glycosylase [Marinicaulis flavus]